MSTLCDISALAVKRLVLDWTLLTRAFSAAYVQAGSATVRVNDRVHTGQKICELGDVGFCPTPHLHIQVCCVEQLRAGSHPFGSFLCTPIFRL